MNAHHPHTSPASPTSPAPHGLSRRTALRTAAWSVPVVTVAAAAPAFAGSGTTNSWVPLAPATAQWKIQGIKRWLEVGRGTSTSLSGIRIVTSRNSSVIKPHTLKVNVAFPYQFVRSDLDMVDRDIVIKDVSPGWVADPPRYTFNGSNRRYATVTFTYTEALQPGGGAFSGGTLPLRFDAQRATQTQHVDWRDVKGLAFTYSAPDFSPSGAGAIAVVN